MNAPSEPPSRKAKTPDQIAFENLLKICPYLLTMQKDSFVELVTKSGAAPSVKIECKGNDLYEINGEYQGRAQIVTFEVDKDKREVEALVFQKEGEKTQYQSEASDKFHAFIGSLARQGYQQKGVARGQGL
jgi:hypothetical protein